jgi:hypothetical protein
MITFLVVSAASFYNVTNAQTDSTKVVKSDTTIAKPDTVLPQTAKKNQKDQKRKDEFILYAGVNFSQIGESSSQYETTSDLGAQLGFSYKRGKLFYWQAGARFNYSQYHLQKISNPADSTDGIGVYDFDLPLNVGINVLSFLNRLTALRFFVGAVPSFTLGVKDNALGVTKDKVNSFMLYGQGGVGFNVAFFVLEVGYNYGFQDLFKNISGSNPGQLFVNLGFRF